MKKILILIIILGALVLLYYMRGNSPVENSNVENTDATSNGDFRPDPSNATFTVDGESIGLSEGKNEREVAPGSVLVEETVLMDKFAYGDINGDGKNDTVLLLARFGGGSGTFVYLGAYYSGPVNYKGSDAVFIGDRISPQSISITNGVVTLIYLDRRPEDPLSTEPTVRTSKQFVLVNNTLQER